MHWDKDGLLLGIVLLILAPYAIVAIGEYIVHYIKRNKAAS